MALQDKLADSILSLKGNGFNPQPKTPSWGYKNPNVDATKLNPLDPSLSALQNTYDVNTNPKDISIVDFNKSPYPSILPKESTLDELDSNAPTNLQAGKKGAVVSQIYKSSKGKTYRDLGPVGGRY
jgi:hypothetical protein